MWKKEHIDFILYEGNHEVVTFRFYPRQSSCHSFGDEPPKNYDDIYKVYFAYSIFIRNKENNKTKVLFQCHCDECSVIDEVAARIALIIEGKRGVTLENGRFIQLLNNEIYPIAYGVSWEIKEWQNSDKYNYEVMMWNWDDTGYRFMLSKNELKNFGLYLQECCEYMLAHGDPI